MNTEVTATALDDWLPARLPTVSPVSTEPNRTMFQQQPGFFILPSEPPPITTIPLGLSDNISDVSLNASTDYSTISTYLDIDSIAEIDALSLFMTELAEKKTTVQQTHQGYRLRIEDLRSDAELDGFTVNEASEMDFWSFIISMSFACEAEVVLLDNGNLRIIWDNLDGNHFGLQFLGDRMLQYVIFRRRRGTNHISRVAGQDTFDGVKRQVRAFELETLLQV